MNEADYQLERILSEAGKSRRVYRGPLERADIERKVAKENESSDDQDV